MNTITVAELSFRRWTIATAVLAVLLAAALLTLLSQTLVRAHLAAQHFLFTSQVAEIFAIAIAAALLGVLVSMLRAHRTAAKCARYRDERQYKEGTLDVRGNIRFEDGSPPIQVPPPDSDRDQIVLVRLRGITAGSYRDAPSTDIAHYFPGSRSYMVRVTLDFASHQHRQAFQWLAIIMIFATFCAGMLRTGLRP